MADAALTALVSNVLFNYNDVFLKGLSASPTYTLQPWNGDDFVSLPLSAEWDESLNQPTSEYYCKGSNGTFSAWNVTYADCATASWIVGYCSRGVQSKEDIFKMLGSLPVYIRSSISDLIYHSGDRSTRNNLHSVSYSGTRAGVDPVDLFSKTISADIKKNDPAGWKDAVNKDTCVADNDSSGDVSKGDFNTAASRAAVVIAYEAIIGPFPVATSCMSNQIAYIKSHASDAFDKAVGCSKKVESIRERHQSVLFPDPLSLSALEELPLPAVAATAVTKWDTGIFPEWCWNMASALRSGQTIASCAPDKIEVYNVTYSDCPQYPWTLCRCSDAQISTDNLVKQFGQNPPGIRSYARHVFALDGTEADGSIKKHGGSNDDQFGVWGPSTQTVFLHENYHSVDQNFHTNADFLAAPLQDTCVPDTYSKSSPAELFAQLGVVYTYDKTKALAARGFDATCMSHQLTVMGTYLPTTKALGACFARRPNSPTVVHSIAKLKAMKVTPWVNPMIIEEF
ncbi:hypothetical protein V490_07516 [Pseudogymnoascus sp. VKM F-3557]|nr:hypothetical protein V490_07516 [Pseudogymnoascus sp. VKM F-3557]